MIVLGIDSLSTHLGAAVVENKDVRAALSTPRAPGNIFAQHRDELLPLIMHVLQKSRTSIGDLGLVAVTHGPGSFTGIRIGLALVQGLLQGTAVPAIGVDTLAAMLRQSGESAKRLIPIVQIRKDRWICRHDGQDIPLDRDAWRNLPRSSILYLLGHGPNGEAVDTRPLTSSLAPAVALLGAESHAAGLSGPAGRLAPRYVGDQYAR